MENQEMRLAVLIDADNAPRTRLGEIMAEIARYGTPTIKRIYGDWTAPNMGSWKPLLLEHAISPVQQYGYTTGKNATDSAMIIDAMDILYSNQGDGFVIVSSDSDFTRLATRLREAGKKVYGIGEYKTPPPFIKTCDKFIYVEVISGEEIVDVKKAEPKKPETAKTAKSTATKKKAEPAAPVHQMSSREKLEALIAESVENLADEDGYAYLGELGTLLVKKQPDFDPRNYGYAKLSKLISSLDRFEVDQRKSPNNAGTQFFLRDKLKK